MTERSQVTDAVQAWKLGEVGSDATVEKVLAILGLEPDDYSGVIQDILEEGEGDPVEAVVNEIDAEWELDFDSGDLFEEDDEPEEEPEPPVNRAPRAK